MSRPTTCVVATRSAAGSRFAAAAAGAAGELGFRVEVLTAPTQSAFARAVVGTDAVVVDTSIEATGGSAYPALTPRLLRRPHVLAVSRTPLPIGLAGRSGADAPPYPAERANDALLDGLRPRLAALAESRRSRLSPLGLGTPGLPPSRGPGVFVGYGDDDWTAARELAARLGAGDLSLAPARATTPVLLAPGELAFTGEVLSWDRCWELAAVVAGRLRGCGTYWLCGAPGPGLRWWNRVELVLVAYLDRSARVPRELRRYDPASGAVDSAAGLVPRLTDAQWRRLDRLLSGSSRAPGPSPRLYVPPRGPAFEVDALLAPGSYVDVPREALATAATRGSATVGPYRITPDPMPRYRWHPYRWGRPTAPPGSIDGALEPLPVFRARPRGEGVR